MAESPDYKELLLRLNEAEVRYLIVGGYAVMKYAEPRFTKDLGIWVECSRENSLRLFQMLKEFGAPLESDGVTPELFTHPELTYQIGIAPVRVDILTTISGVEFESAWKDRVQGSIFGVSVHFISLAQLIANKKSTGRRSDLEQLEQIRRKTSPAKKPYN